MQIMSGTFNGTTDKNGNVRLNVNYDVIVLKVVLDSDYDYLAQTFVSSKVRQWYVNISDFFHSAQIGIIVSGIFEYVVV